MIEEQNRAGIYTREIEQLRTAGRSLLAAHTAICHAAALAAEMRFGDGPRPKRRGDKRPDTNYPDPWAECAEAMQATRNALLHIHSFGLTLKNYDLWFGIEKGGASEGTP